MTKYWRILDRDLCRQIDAVFDAREKVGKQLKALCKSIGATNVAYQISFFTGMIQSVRFRIDNHLPVDATVFTKADKDGWRKVKASQHEVHDQIAHIVKQEVDWSPILRKLGIKESDQFDGMSVWAPGFKCVDGFWYITTKGKFSGSRLLKRVTDVEMEKLSK